MKKSKWLSMLLIICMLLSLMPAAAFAEDTANQQQATEQGGNGQEETTSGGEQTTPPDGTTPGGAQSGADNPPADEGEPPSEEPGETPPTPTDGENSTDGTTTDPNNGPTTEQPADGSEAGKPGEGEKLVEDEKNEQKPADATLPELQVTKSILDAAGAKDKKAASFYNVIFAGGKNVIVEPAPAAKAGESATGLLVTIGDQKYTYATSSTNYLTDANDGLTIFAGYNGEPENAVDSQEDAGTPVAGDSTITIKNGAKVGAIFAGGYGTSETGHVTIAVDENSAAGTIYGGGLTKINDPNSTTKTGSSSITVDGAAGIIYAGGRASVGTENSKININDTVKFNAENPTASTANTYVGTSEVIINGTVETYMGGGFSYGGVGQVNCTVNGTVGTGKNGNYSAVSGTNGFHGSSTMLVTENGKIDSDLYCAMRGYVGDVTLTNKGSINRVSLNPDGKAVASYGNIYVTNATDTPLQCNLDCGCTKTTLVEGISSYPAQIKIKGNATVSTAFWETNKDGKLINDGNYTAQEGQTIVLLGGAQMAEDEEAITNVATAQIGDGESAQYYTLADAVANVNNGETITMLSNATLSKDLTIENGKDFTLDLNGQTITSKASINLDKGGKIAINDTNADGSGTINFTSGHFNILGNRAYSNRTEILSTLTLDKGTITSSKDATICLFGNGATFTMNGGEVINTYTNGKTDGNFAIAGNGTRRSQDGGKDKPIRDDGGIHITINDGLVKSVQDSAIYLPGVNNTTITGGTIEGWSGIEIDSGTLTISDNAVIKSTYNGDGTRKYKLSGDGNYNFGAALAIVSKGSQHETDGYVGHMDITIDGGTFESPSYYAIDEYNLADVQQNRVGTEDAAGDYIDTLDITGGNFKGAGGAILSDNMTNFISGGNLSHDLPRKYLASGKVVTAGTEAGYPYMVTEGSLPENVDTGAISGEPDVVIPEEASIPEAAEAAVTAAAEKIAADTNVLEAAAKATINQTITEEQVEEAKKALSDASISLENATVTIVAKTYLDIKPQAYESVGETDNAVKVLTLDITPMYKLIATTADLKSDGEIVLSSGSTTGDKTPNAVELPNKPQPLTVTEETEITAPLPKGFISDATTSPLPPLYVRHDKDANNVYYYIATVDEYKGSATIATDASGGGGTDTDTTTPTHQATFTSLHGFSPFTLMTAAPSVDVAFQMYNTNTTQTITYSLNDDGKITSTETDSLPQIEQSLPADTRPGYNFQGWSFFNGADPVLSGPYKQMNSTLLSQLAALTGPITATPQFTSKPSGGGGEPEKPDVPGDETIITILFDKLTAADETLTFTKESIGQSFPTDKRSGYTFRGWTFSGIDGVYKSLEQALFDKLAEMTGTITATPSFRVIDDDTPSGGGAIDGPGGDTSDSSSSGGSSGGGTAAVTHTITASAGDGGLITPSGKVSAANGTDKTFTITANAGYILTDVLVDGQSVGAVSTYTFENITKAHTISALFAQTTGLPFVDVTTDDWYYPAVKSVYNQELMRGVTQDRFGPGELTTRGMIVTILYRLEGEPQAEVQAAFDDVARSDWYAQAIDWAAAEGIVNGYSATSFGPNDPITREQLAAILRNYAAYKGQDVSATADLSGFTDQPSEWALASVQWAAAHNLLSGKGDGVLDAAGYATRAEAAAVLTRFLAL